MSNNTMSTVTVVSSDMFSRHSAAIVHMMELCSAFVKNGFNTKLCVPKFPGSIKFLFDYYGVEYPFEIIQIGVPKLFGAATFTGRGVIFSLLAANRLSKMNNTIIYSRNSWIFFILSVLYNRPCFYEAHQFRFKGRLQTKIYRGLVKRGVKSGNGRIVCISKSLMRHWENYGIVPEKMCVVHDAVNINKFYKTISKEEARRQLGFDKNLSIVVYTGSLIAGKGVDILIKCSNRLPHISFIIVGGEKEHIIELRQLVKFSNVIFTGNVPPSKIPVYQAAADILVLPNTKGGVIDDVTSPLKLFEYIASRRPIVATDMPSLLEILKDNYNALISPAGDDYKLSENIQLLFETPTLGELLVNNASQKLEEYSWDARVQYLSKLFDNFYY